MQALIIKHFERVSFLVEVEGSLVFGAHVSRILIEEIGHLFIDSDCILVGLVAVAGNVETCFALIERALGLSSLVDFLHRLKTDIPMHSLRDKKRRPVHNVQADAGTI